jgi:hypothetical protein
MLFCTRSLSGPNLQYWGKMLIYQRGEFFDHKGMRPVHLQIDEIGDRHSGSCGELQHLAAIYLA